MEARVTYERYPLSIIALSNLVAASIYALGTYLMTRLGIWWAVPYLLYCGWMEYRLLSKHCVDCCYYGKLCAFGKGRLSSVFFKQGDPQRFAQADFGWRDMIPDMLVLGFPAIAAAVALIRGFNWITLAVLVVMVVVSFGGNAWIRGTYACPHCKQRELGCPAEQLFNKSAKTAETP
jgi:hypothetical protein